jgi:putative transposase
VLGVKFPGPTRHALGDSSDHYHEERPHQGLDNELIAPKPAVVGTGAIKCRERLGGLLKFYNREAA